MTSSWSGRSSPSSRRPGWPASSSVATKAETRASELAAERRERLDALETLNRITARFDGSQPVADGHPGRHRRHRPRVRDHARVDLPADQRRAAVDGRRGRLSPPVPRDRRRRRHHRPGRRDATRRSTSPTSSATPTTSPPGTTSGPRSRPRSSTATSCSRVVNFEGTLGTADRPGPGRPGRDGRPVALGGTPLGQARRRAAPSVARDRARAGGQPVARRRPRPAADRRLDRRRRRRPARPPISSGCSRRRVDGVYELEAGVGVRDGAIGSAAPPGLGAARALRCRAGTGRRIARSPSWPIAVGASAGRRRPTPHSAMALPIEVADDDGGRPARQPRGRGTAATRRSSAASPTC